MNNLAELSGESPAIVRLKEQVSRLILRQAEGARRHAPILILGETGTGKGLLAGIVHRAGPRSGGPFIDVNCAAIPANLFESELFGFERGAFTDARQAKPGLIQSAHRGTLFLDEIGLLPEGSQAKLLKALEEQSVRRLGATRSEAVDVWLLAATSENLDAAVQARRFREDLYHRLAVVTLRLPPLRERGDDILRLADLFLGRACEDYGLAPRTLSADAREALKAYTWPGNVRELANVIERVALLSDGVSVTAATLGLPSPPRARLGAAPGGVAARRAVIEAEADTERSRIIETLRTVKWNISQAAVRLGMPRNTLRYRMDKLGLGTEPKASPSVELAATAEPAATAVRWEPRRVTFVRARLLSRGAEPASSENGRIMELIVDKIRSFGGHVEELGATSLVAAFGLEPIEDVAVHAASAALAIQKRQPGVRLAIHTAPVLVGHHPGGHDVDTDAKRLTLEVLDAVEARAEPGAIAVSADAAPFLARRFEVSPGLSRDAGPGYRLVGPIAPEHRFKTGFVGREPELGMLSERFHQAEGGHGQIVSVVGEPGMGKTRLLREFRRRMAADVAWMEGQAIAFGATIPFHPLIDLVRRAFQIDEGDSEGVIVEKIERAVPRSGEDLRPALPFFRYLLSVDPSDPEILQLNPQLRRAGIFDTMRRFFTRAAEDRPLVIVWEDLHWSDQATEEFLALLADSVAAHRILMIVAGRPGYSPPAANRTFHTRLALTALSPSDSVAMARELLSVERLPETLETLLVRRAEGNPFFLEELLRAYRETGTANLESLTLPDTVQDVIRSRIERLSVAPRRVLDVASVIGREFARRVIDRLADSPEASEHALRELGAAELIHEKSLFPELTYVFKHAVTQEVAYDALDPERRTELHRAIGLALETLHADRLAEHADVLAHHFAKARAWPKALEYLLKAAKKAANSFAIREALTLYDRVLEAAGQSGGPTDIATAIEVHRAKAVLYYVVNDFDPANIEAEHVIRLARQLGDRIQEAKALARIAWAAIWQGDPERAVAHAREAIDLGRSVGNEEVLARAYFTIAYARAGTGDLAEARQAIAQALASGRASETPAYLSLSLSVAGHLKNWEGEYGAASELQVEGLQLARQHNLLAPLLFGFFFHGLTLSNRGEYQDALALFREGLALAERVGDETIHYSRLLNCLGWLHLELGDFDRAIELSSQSAAVSGRGRRERTFQNAEINLGNIFLAKGDLVQAGEFLDGAARAWDPSRTSRWLRWRYAMRLSESLGRLWLARGDPARAQEFADQCLELATSTSSRKNLVKAWRLRGEISLARRSFDDAEIGLRQALAVATAIDNPAQLWKTQLAWGHLCAARQRPDEAAESYRAARAVFGRVKAAILDPGLRATLARKHPELGV